MVFLEVFWWWVSGGIFYYVDLMRLWWWSFFFCFFGLVFLIGVFMLSLLEWFLVCGFSCLCCLDFNLMELQMDHSWRSAINFWSIKHFAFFWWRFCSFLNCQMYEKEFLISEVKALMEQPKFKTENFFLFRCCAPLYTI